MSITPYVVALAGLVLLSGSAPAWAPGSEVVLSAQGTTGSPRTTWEKRMLEAARPKPFGVRYEISVTESPVPATTRDEFLRTLSAAVQDMRGDRTNTTRAPGSGQVRVSWEWKPEVHLSECRFKEVTIDIRYSIDVAQLAGPLAEDSTARAWWAAEVERGFTRRVEVLKMMRDGSKSLYRKLNTMTSNTCSNLVERANSIARTAVEDMYTELEKPRLLPAVR